MTRSRDSPTLTVMPGPASRPPRPKDGDGSSGDTDLADTPSSETGKPGTPTAENPEDEPGAAPSTDGGGDGRAESEGGRGGDEASGGGGGVSGGQGSSGGDGGGGQNISQPAKAAKLWPGTKQLGIGSAWGAGLARSATWAPRFTSRWAPVLWRADSTGWEAR